MLWQFTLYDEWNVTPSLKIMFDKKSATFQLILDQFLFWCLTTVCFMFHVQEFS